MLLQLQDNPIKKLVRVGQLYSVQHFYNTEIVGPVYLLAGGDIEIRQGVLAGQHVHLVGNGNYRTSYICGADHAQGQDHCANQVIRYIKSILSLLFAIATAIL